MNSQALQQLLALAEREENLAAQQLAEARRLAEACRAQLDDLVAYRGRPAHHAGSLVSAAHFAQAGRFLDRVDEALRLQAERLRELDRRVHDCERNWSRLRGERRALEKLLENERAAALADERRREQRVTDEAAAQAWARGSR